MDIKALKKAKRTVMIFSVLFLLLGVWDVASYLFGALTAGVAFDAALYIGLCSTFIVAFLKVIIGVFGFKLVGGEKISLSISLAKLVLVLQIIGLAAVLLSKQYETDVLLTYTVNILVLCSFLKPAKTLYDLL